MDKNLLHIRSSGGILGAENVILEIAKHSPEFGYRSVIGAIKNSGEPDPEFLNVAKDYDIRTVVFEARRSLDPSLPGRIRRFITDHRVDILHCHGYKEDFYGILTRTNIPKVATNHLWKRSTFRSKIYAFIDVVLLRLFDQVVGVSDEIVDEMRRYLIPRPVKIANGVDIERFRKTAGLSELHDRMGIRPGDIVFGMVSSLSTEKGHMVAIQAIRDVIKEYPETRLFIIGEGELRSEIENQVGKFGLGRHVALLGKRLDIPDMLSVMDVFLLPSYKEGLPMAMLEAMAAGKAVIATRVGENGKVITHKQNGLLIDPGDPHQLRAAIMELIHDRALIRSLGDNARAEVEANYSSRSMTRKYCDIYTEVLGANM